MKVKLKDIGSNPLRCEIGILSDRQINSIIESCETSEYGKYYQFDVRKAKGKKGKYELVYGHHRYKAFEKFYGKDHYVSIVIKDYDDDQMFVEMCRENLTKENDAITQGGIFAATKKRLEQTVKGVGGSKKTHKAEVGARQIASALSKTGITVSHETVRKRLAIHEGLAPDLKVNVGRKDRASDKKAQKVLPVQIAGKISNLEHDEQRAVVKALDKSSEQRVAEQVKIVERYEEAPDAEKKAVRDGNMDIALVGTGVGGAAPIEEREKKLKLDSILKQIAKDIDHATRLLTDSVVKGIRLASKERRNNFQFAVNRFLKRLNEMKDEADDEVI